MKQILLIIITCLTLSSYSQVIEYAENEYVDCDTAYTNLELAICLSFKLTKLEHKLDSLYNSTLDMLDVFILEDDELKKGLLADDYNYDTEMMTDYRKIKEMVIKSQNVFIHYANMEMEITGEFIGRGKERPIHENERKIELIERRILDLEKILE